MRRLLVIVLLAVVALGGGAAYYMSLSRVPAEAIATSVIRDEALLAKAWALPVAATYRDGFLWQPNPSLCGPASAANVFRSLGLEPQSAPEVLDGTGKCFFGICPVGLTLDELGEVVDHHYAGTVTVLRDLSLEAFTEHLRQANDPSRRYIVNFHRSPIFGAGAGHFSPIGGYLEDEDLVLVLDVNRDFQPWLIERERLFAAMDTFDGDRKRGLLLLQ